MISCFVSYFQRKRKSLDNIPKEQQNTVSYYKIHNYKNEGFRVPDIQIDAAEADLMEIVIVRLGMIMKILLDNKRYADAKRASEDETYREQLYKEFEI